MTEDLQNDSSLIEPTELEADETSYRVSLPAFEGPLDLLLHLIKKNQVDIYDIPIALITEQYNQYLDAMQELNVELAADFIYMAALLIHIKSKMLLPRREDDGAPQEDPRQELVDRLLEHQRFKSVAETFAELERVRTAIWTRPPSAPEGEPAPVELGEVSLFDLIDAFRTALVRYKVNHPQAIEIARPVHKVSDKMAELVKALAATSPIRLLFFLEGRDRGELIAIFLAVLELVRLGGIQLRQSESFGEIVMERSDQTLDHSQFAIYDR